MIVAVSDVAIRQEENEELYEAASDVFIFIGFGEANKEGMNL